MITKLSTYLKDTKVFIGIAMVLSLYIRFHNFLANPSLYIDEANVACNIAERGMFGFWSKLDYEQYAPPIFMMLTKLNVFVFGYREFALRLLPFISSIVCLFLLYKLADKFISNKPLIGVVVLLFGLNYWCIFQSYSLKQYVPDLAIALALTLVALKADYQRFYDRKALLWWTIAGSVLVWSSMPVVYVMAAMGAYFAWQAWRDQAFFKWLPYFAVPVSIWVVNFGIYFFTILKADATTDYLQNYHKIYFLTHELWTGEGIAWNGKILGKLLTEFISDSGAAIGAFLVFYVIGVIFLLRKKTSVGLLLIVPFFLALLSSMLGYYSLITRLVIFTFPIQFIVMGIGMDTVINTSALESKLMTTLAALFLVYNLNSWAFVGNRDMKIVLENTRASLEYISENRAEGEPLLINHSGMSVTKFYVNYHAKNEKKFGNCKDYQTVPFPKSLVEEAARTLEEHPSKRVWVLLGHLENHVADQKVAELVAHPNIAVAHQEMVWRSRAVVLTKK